MGCFCFFDAANPEDGNIAIAAGHYLASVSCLGVVLLLRTVWYELLEVTCNKKIFIRRIKVITNKLFNNMIFSGLVK